MDASDTFQLIILIILLILSAFFSSNETALMAVNKIRLRSLADEGNKRAAMVLDITENHTQKMLSAILIGNNIVNITCLSFWRLYGQYRNCRTDCCDPRIRRDYPEELCNAQCREGHAPLYSIFQVFYDGHDTFHLHH